MAYLQVVGAYLGMFFIIVHGWDGTGYQRFFSATPADFASWSGDWTAFLTSDVALSLYGMGVVLLPVLLLTVAHWQVTGYALDADGATARTRPGRIAVVALNLASVFAAGLGLAVVAHLAIAWLGAAAGIPVAITLCALALLPRGPVYALYRALALPEHGVAGPRFASCACAGNPGRGRACMSEPATAAADQSARREELLADRPASVLAARVRRAVDRRRGRRGGHRQGAPVLLLRLEGRGFYVAVVQAAATQLRGRWDADPTVPAERRLAENFDAYLAYARERPEGYRALMTGGVGTDPQVRSILAAEREQVIRRVVEAFGRREPGPALRTALQGWLSFMEGATLEWLDAGGLDPAQLRDLLLAALEGALRAAHAVDPTVPPVVE